MTAAPVPVAGHLSHRRMQHGLVWVLSRKNFQVRYKRAVLGVLWAVVQPSFQAAFLSFIFLKVFRYGRSIEDYPVFVLSGMLPWAFFTQGVMAATGSVVENASLVRKVSLSRVIFPLSAAGGVAIAFTASLVILVIGSIVSGNLGFHLLLLIPAALLETVVIVAVGILACAFHVAFRDVRYLMESAMMIGLYATPILYTVSQIPEGLRPFFRLNPMTGVMSLYRSAVLGYPLDVASVVSGAAIAAVVLALALVLFARRSEEFPDLV